MRVYLIASKVTDSVVYGFLPAARRLGLELTVLTDQPEAHERAITAARSCRRPGAIGAPDPAAVERAVRDPRTSGAWEIVP